MTPETIQATKELVGTFIRLLEVLGPWWTLAYCVLFGGAFVGLYIWRARQLEQGWERALAAKSEMIDQINRQNRELRVQALVMGGHFSHKQAVELVYQDDSAGLAPPNTSSLAKPKSRRVKK